MTGEPRNALTRYFLETGESLSSLAAKMQRPASTLTRPVNGERNPSVALAREVERVTGGRVTASEFIEVCMAAAKTRAPSGAAA